MVSWMRTPSALAPSRPTAYHCTTPSILVIFYRFLVAFIWLSLHFSLAINTNLVYIYIVCVLTHFSGVSFFFYKETGCLLDLAVKLIVYFEMI